MSSEKQTNRGRKAGPKIEFSPVTVTGDEAPKTHSFDVMVQGNKVLTLARKKVRVKSPDYAKDDAEFGYRTTFAAEGLESFTEMDWSIGASQTKNAAGKRLREAVREGWIPEGWTPPPPPEPKIDEAEAEAESEESEIGTESNGEDDGSEAPPAKL